MYLPVKRGNIRGGPLAAFGALLLSLPAVQAPAGVAPAAAADTEIALMSFNVWGAGRNDGQPLERTIAAIRAAAPDIVGLQEVRPEAADCIAGDCPPRHASVAPQLALALDFHLLEQTAASEALWANAILSRFPIRGPTSGGLGARIDVHGREIVVFNIHLTDFPYQPYQLLDIAYGNAPFLATADEAVASARKARGPALTQLLQEADAAAAADLLVITGDFNEPSHRDWTASAVAAGRHPLVVRWPFTLALEAAGFADAFRTVHPDVVARPGFTWSPLIGADSRGDHRDRIDYVFVRGAGARVVSARVVGEPGPWSDIAVAPWPSDHRAVLARIQF